MLDLQTFIDSKNLFLIPYLGNSSRRRNFSGWYRGKTGKEDRHEFYLITRGQGVFTVGEEICPVCEGDLVYIPSIKGIPYNLNPGKNLVDYYSINISCAVAAHKNEVWLYDESARYHYQSVPYPENEEWSFKRSQEPFDLPAACSMDNYAKLRELMSRIHKMRTDSDPINYWEEKNILQQFLCGVALQNQSPDREDMNTRRLRRITAYIRQHYMEDITLKTLCSTVSLSPSYVIKLFNRHLSLSPMAYVSRIRVEAAKEMLLESPLSIAEIAARTGFQDGFYFSKKFKQLTGMTPRQYRNTL
ncbi:AraC family transcriptional regulator [Clostridium sp. FS41]|uniref:AraC family transcriptional regulator n=1 Tax=Clostridia TaxID=186801 RepID=UPI0005D3F8A3|nr:AraC family transcriptional regulator [Clostridium sp. FS41]KJJ72415.1 HTH-type transcriptional activator Btr [Clostridium sp. FS41]